VTTAVLRCAGGGVQIEEVDVATPRGKLLARRLTAAVPFDEGLLVTGPNGSGTLLLVLIASSVPLWQTQSNHNCLV
jgi:ABC-type uncharacterized transport system fused permease/ATPase subunit